MPARSATTEAIEPVSARAASDAAIPTEARGSALGSAPLAELTKRIERRAVVDLLAFDPGAPSRLRRSKAHAPLVAMTPPPRTHQKVDAPPAEQTPEERGRADVLRVLSCGVPLGPDALHASVDALLDDPYEVEIPLLLVEGEVKPTMDEVKTLRVAAELAKPLAGDNKRIHAILALANDTLTRAVAPIPESAAALFKQLEAAIHEQPLPSRHFADLVDRTLLESRSYKRRTLLGAPRIRAELTLGRVAFPIYLPEAAASQLPLLSTFPLTALVELRPREDASEPNATSLVAFALGRVLRARRQEHRG